MGAAGRSGRELLRGEVVLVPALEEDRAPGAEVGPDRAVRDRGHRDPADRVREAGDRAPTTAPQAAVSVTPGPLRT